MNLENKTIKHSELFLMIAMLGILILIVGVLIDSILNITGVAFCGIIIFGIALWLFCAFIYKEELR